MLKLNSLASGSSGNCYIMETTNRYVMVDVGLPLYKIENLFNFSPEKPIDLFITHEHTDHVVGIKPFIKKYKPNVYSSEGTALSLSLKNIDASDFYIMDSYNIYSFDEYEVVPFDVLHDGNMPFGFRFDFSSKSICFATDLGVVTEQVLRVLKECHTIILESNYEESMLKNGSYPQHLKKRVLSTKGHLSNADAINTVSKIFQDGLKQVFFGHISEENNDYNLMEKYTAFCIKNFSVSACYFKQNTPAMEIVI